MWCNNSPRGMEMKVDYKYKLGYDILMDYWDCIPEEEKPKVHEQLKEIGL